MGVKGRLKKSEKELGGGQGKMWQKMVKNIIIGLSRVEKDRLSSRICWLNRGHNTYRHIQQLVIK
jgi:hypothetical protein